MHKDFHAAQCLVRGGDVSAVIDWDGMGRDDPWIDYAKHEVYAVGYGETFARRFYAALRPLPDD